jgi:acetyltransferase-like isoleucine patch superfamily enzyme/uncharacterized membrane protein YbhN (UPF0104 family)
MPEGHFDKPQTEMQAGLTAAARGGVRGLYAKYREMCLGHAPLLLYELAMTLAQNTGGALGMLLRKNLYPRLLGRCGRGVIFGKGVTLRHPDRIWIGDGAVIDDNVVLDAKGPDGEAPNIVIGDSVFLGRGTILSCKGGTIELGDNVNLGASCQIQSESSCRVGANVLFAGYCYVVAGGNHGLARLDIPPIQQQPISRGGVTICDGAWLGANVKVIDGVTMGRDSVAAAGAVLVRSCADYDIVGGVPAKVLRNRRAEAGAGQGTGTGQPPAGETPNRLTPATRHDPADVAEGSPAGEKKPSTLRTLRGTAIKLLLSAGLIWYLFALYSAPAKSTFDSIVPGETSRESLRPPDQEAVSRAPRASMLARIGGRLKAVFTMEAEAQPLLPVAGAGTDEVTYGVAVQDKDGNWVPDDRSALIALRFGADGKVAAKEWKRGFWAAVWEQVKDFKWHWFAFVGVFHLIGYIITSWNWRMMLEVQGKHARLWPLMNSNIVSGLFNNFLPTNVGGDVVRIRDSAIGVFGTSGKNDYLSAATVVLVQRVIGIFALLLIVSVALVAHSGDQLLKTGDTAMRIGIFAGVVVLVGVAAAVFLQRKMLARVAAVLDIFRGLPLVGKMASKFMFALEIIARYREQHAHLLRIFLSRTLLEVNVIVYYYFCTFVVAAPVGFLTVLTAAPLVIILMAIVPSINGVGVRDWGFQYFLGLSVPVAIAFALLDVLWRLIWGVIGGALLALRGPVRPGAWLVAKSGSARAPAEGK